MAKNLVSGQNLGPQNFLNRFYLYMLNIVAIYHCMQFQAKLMSLNWENGKKTSFGINFGTFDPNLDPQNFFMDSNSTAR